MRETQYKEIDGHRYSCTMMPVRKAHQTWVELVAVLGQPVVSAIGRASQDQDQQVQELISSAASMALMNIDAEVADRLLASLFDGVRADGIGEWEPWDAKFDAHFRGKVFSMYKVWAWSLQVNYQDFLDAARGLGLNEMLETGKSALKDHLTSTQESGESSPPNPSRLDS